MKERHRVQGCSQTPPKEIPYSQGKNQPWTNPHPIQVIQIWKHHHEKRERIEQPWRGMYLAQSENEKQDLTGYETKEEVR